LYQSRDPVSCWLHCKGDAINPERVGVFAAFSADSVGLIVVSIEGPGRRHLAYRRSP
jgi:hypothetical protein